MENTDQSKWVLMYLCENPTPPPPKESAPNLSIFIVVCDVMVFLEFSTYKVLNGESSDVSGYESSILMV